MSFYPSPVAFTTELEVHPFPSRFSLEMYSEEHRYTFKEKEFLVIWKISAL